MRIGNSSLATPRGFFLKLSEKDIEKLATKALLLANVGNNNIYTSFTIKVPTWYSVKKPEKQDFWVNGSAAEAIYIDNNDYSTKPGVIAEWIIRIYK